MKTKLNRKRISLLIKANIIESYRTISLFWIIFTPIVGLIFLLIFVASIDNSADAIQVGARLVQFFLFFAVVTMGYINDVMFKTSMKVVNLPFKYALPAKLSEKYVANIVTALFIAPLFPIISFILIVLLPTIIFHVTYGYQWFYIFSAVAEAVPSMEAIINFVWFFNILVALSIITDVHWWSSKRTIMTISVILGFVVGFSALELSEYLFFDTTYLTTYVVYPAIAIVAWIASYYAFKRKELKA